MRAPLKVVGVGLGLVLVLGAAAFALFSFSGSMTELRAFEKKFASVDIGDSESKAIALLGPPDAKESAFRLGQERGYEESYARAAASRSAHYLVWSRGIDVVFSVGIDANGTVRLKEYGGT